MGWLWKTSANGLSHVECDVNDSSNATRDSVQVCSMLHVAHVGVRRVTLVIVHNGLKDSVEGVLVVIHTYVAICSELLYQEVFSLHKKCLVHQCGSKRSISGRLEAHFWHFLQPFPVLPLWFDGRQDMVWRTAIFATSQCPSVHFLACPPCHDTKRPCSRGIFFKPSIFSVAPAEVRSSNIFSVFIGTAEPFQSRKKTSTATVWWNSCVRSIAGRR